MHAEIDRQQKAWGIIADE